MLSQAGSSLPSLADSTPARSALSQAGSPQVSPVDSTLSLAKSVLSQAGSSLPSLADSTPARSALSQAGSPQVSPGENTLSPAESELSQGSSSSSPEDSTLQAERHIPPQAVRHSARLRARQADNSSREVSEVSQ